MADLGLPVYIHFHGDYYHLSKTCPAATSGHSRILVNGHAFWIDLLREGTEHHVVKFLDGHKGHRGCPNCVVRQIAAMMLAVQETLEPGKLLNRLAC